ncbi:hypothetical protein GCM10027456_57600 [Kineosporia babensis]
MDRIGEEESKEGNGHCTGQADTKENQRQRDMPAERGEHTDLKTENRDEQMRGAGRPAGTSDNNGSSPGSVTPIRALILAQGALRSPIRWPGPWSAETADGPGADAPGPPCSRGHRPP